MSEISVRFLIDKEHKRVVFAEAGSDFIDVLFSFLTLPLGSIVRLLDKQSGLGSLDSLYMSVEQLDAKHLQTEACKEMLLNPRSAAAIICEDLKIKDIHDADPRDIYLCNESGCLVQSTCYYTYLTKGRCGRCGKLMDYSLCLGKGTAEKGGVFVNDKADFIIADDLRVIPTSLMSGFSLLEELRIKDASILEERVMDFGTEEALNLLRRSLASKSALTEVGEDFIDQLLSFLTFPLGSVLRLIGNHISLDGCIINLYSSAESLGLDCFKSEDCKNILVSPKLASFYGCRNQILKMGEIASNKMICSMSCLKCFQDNGCKPCLSAPCKHGLREADLIEQNPNLENGGLDSVGGFVNDSTRFMVANNLHISRLSSISAITKGIDSLISDLVEVDLRLDNAKVLSLLSAMLISKTVLTDVFSPKSRHLRSSKFL